MDEKTSQVVLIRVDERLSLHRTLWPSAFILLLQDNNGPDGVCLAMGLSEVYLHHLFYMCMPK